MAIFAATENLDMSVLANYQTLMGDIYDQIVTTAGWVQTADTGQTNPRGVGSLPTAATYTNYAIYKTNDGLTTVYLRVGFGRNTSTSPAIDVKIGTSTDGAGTITGNVSGLTTTLPDGNGTGTGHIYVTGTAGRLGISTSPVQTNGTGILVWIERSHNGAATDTSDYMTIAVSGSGVGTSQHSVMMSGTNALAQTGIRAAMPNPSTGGGTWIQGGTNTGVAFAVPMPTTYNAQPMLGLVLHTSLVTDFAVDTTTTIAAYGSTHTYLVTGKASNNGNSRCMIRYE